MNYFFKYFVIIALITGCYTRTSIIPSVDSRTSPHNDKEKRHCSMCHIGNSVKIYGDASELCLRCHPMGKNDHPLGVGVEESITTWLPLGENRVVECHTCHDQHNRTQQRFMLRTEFNKLCRECHNRK